jgi:hypothetical protein
VTTYDAAPGTAVQLNVAVEDVAARTVKLAGAGSAVGVGSGVGVETGVVVVVAVSVGGTGVVVITGVGVGARAAVSPIAGEDAGLGFPAVSRAVTWKKYVDCGCRPLITAVCACGPAVVATAV